MKYFLNDFFLNAIADASRSKSVRLTKQSNNKDKNKLTSEMITALLNSSARSERIFRPTKELERAVARRFVNPKVVPYSFFRRQILTEEPTFSA